MNDLYNPSVEKPSSQRFIREVENLACRIEAEWQRAQYDDDAFPEIAEQCLVDEQLHGRYDPLQVIRECITGPVLVPQIDIRARFGQPPITLFRNSRFYVSVLFWADSTTAIHQHGFSGAFCVLGGSSLHVGYRFTPRVQVNSRLAIGEISRQSVNILEHGSVERIIAGREGAHALFHLERPSLTLIVRTHIDRRAHPQLTYHWPCYAIDPFFDDDVITRKGQLLKLVYQCDRALLIPIVTELLASLDFESAVRVLLDLRRFDLGASVVSELAQKTAGRHGRIGEGLVRLVEAGDRDTKLINLRFRVLDPERRLLLAFLLNRLSFPEVRALVTNKYPGSDATDLVSAWIVSLLEEVGGMEGSPIVRRVIQLLVAGDRLPDISGKLGEELGITADADFNALAMLLRTLSSSALFSSLFDLHNTRV